MSGESISSSTTGAARAGERRISRAAESELSGFARDAIARLGHRVVVARLAMTPIGAGLLATVLWMEHATWRRLVLGAAIVGMVSFSVFEGTRRTAPSKRRIAANFAVMLAALLLSMTATGGIESPMTPALLLACSIPHLLVPGVVSRVIAITSVVAVLALTTARQTGIFPSTLPDALGGDQHGAAALVWSHAAALCGTSLMAHVLAGALRDAFDRIAAQGVAAREAALESLAAETRTLTQFSAEIAHELKNPLATVKGLAGMLAKNATGKDVERVAVLRREVDRMHAVLQSFLDFARPLTPLVIADVDVAALCADMAALHEGIAGERRVRLAVRVPPDLVVRCDVRKIEQVLVNVIQNALAVAPAETTLTIAASRDEASKGVRIDVIDDGPGISPEIAARIFDPGVTTKKDGSGLGLTIARMLSRQHGGDLTIDDRARTQGAQGCCVTLQLPFEPSPPLPAVATGEPAA